VSRYPVPFDDLPDLPSQPVSKTARKAEENNGLVVYRYGLGAAARAQMFQYDVQAREDGADAAIKASLNVLNKGLAEAKGSATGAEIVGQWVAEVQGANLKLFRHRFGV
jgi:hypothetical protein